VVLVVLLFLDFLLNLRNPKYYILTEILKKPELLK